MTVVDINHTVLSKGTGMDIEVKSLGGLGSIHLWPLGSKLSYVTEKKNLLHNFLLNDTNFRFLLVIEKMQFHIRSIRISHMLFWDKFKIGQYNTVVQLKAAVRAIQQMGGGTKTGDALKYMKNLFAKATRTNVPQILIVITDGKSQDAVTSPAEELRQEGIIIYAIGINPSLGFLLTSVNVNNLQFRANNPAFYFQCKVFANVCSMFFYFPACENVKADIIFLVDGSESIHPVDFQKMKDFMQLIVNRSDIGTDKVRIGLLQFSSEAKEEFQLNRYSTKTGLRRAISEIRQLKSGTLTGKALAFAASYFDKTKGGRPEIKQYLIVITDGEAQDSVGEPAKMIRDKGIIIYAIGVLQANETQLVEISGTPGKVIVSASNDFLNSLFLLDLAIFCS
uniref:VWFA domain-containing protein n=1 Tax=Crocodylus porosus TaxID=8502 RepID=A0A7M4EDK8_CROPO